MQPLKNNQTVNNMIMKNQKVNKMMMKKMKNIEQQLIQSNQLSCGDMICGSVRIDDSRSNTNTRIKQYISMINDEMNNMLQRTKLNGDVIELDSKNTITDDLKVIYDRLKR